MKQHDKKASWRAMDLSGVYFHIVGKKRGQELKQNRNLETRTEAMEGAALTGLLSVAGSACFLIEPRTMSPVLVVQQWPLVLKFRSPIFTLDTNCEVSPRSPLRPAVDRKSRTYKSSYAQGTACHSEWRRWKESRAGE